MLTNLVATNVTPMKQATRLFSSAWEEQEAAGHQGKGQWPNSESRAEADNGKTLTHMLAKYSHASPMQIYQQTGFIKNIFKCFY